MNQQQINHDDAMIGAIICAFAVGVFATLCLSSLVKLDSPMSLDAAKTVYAQIAATFCGMFFFLILTMLAIDTARSDKR
jgi:hypothetical protein